MPDTLKRVRCSPQVGRLGLVPRGDSLGEVWRGLFFQKGLFLMTGQPTPP